VEIHLWIIEVNYIHNFLEVKVPNHYYGYEPEEPNNSFGSPDEVMDTVYRRPLQDMSTNPNSPLYQAMDNQRGPTYSQMLENEDEGDAYVNDLETTIVEGTPLSQAMDNQGDQTSDTFGMEEYLESLGIDNSGEGGMPTDEQIAGFEAQNADVAMLGNTGGGRTEPTAGTVDVNTGNTGGRTEPTAGTPGPPLDENDLGGSGTDDEPDKDGTTMTDRDSYVPLPSDPGGNSSTGSGNTGGNTGGSIDGTQSNFRGSMLEQALSDYNVEELQKEYGNVFDEYGDRRELFVNQRGELADQVLDLQRGEANIGLERQQGQLGRQEGLLESQLDFNTQSDLLAQRRLGLQRTSLEARQGDIDEDYALRQQMFGLQEDQQAQALDAARSGARGNLMNLYQQSNVTGGFAGSGARDMVRQRAISSYTDNAQNRISSLADTRRIGLAKQQATQQRDRQRRGLGSQLSGLGIADEQRQLQFDNQQGRVSSQLEGIQSELGDDGFLQRSFDSRMQGIDITGRQQALGREESIFNLRDDYKKDVRSRLIDIIRGGGDLSPFKLTEQEKIERGDFQRTQYGGMSAYDTGFGGDSLRE